MNPDYRKLKVTIIGSYRKHLQKLFKLREVIEQEGLLVLSPVGNISLNPSEEFVLLDEDPINDPRLLQDSIFSKFRASSFVVVGNFDNYLGNTALFEMGYAAAFGIPLLTVEPVKDVNLSTYCRLLTDLFPHISMNSFSEKSSIEALV